MNGFQPKLTLEIHYICKKPKDLEIKDKILFLEYEEIIGKQIPTFVENYDFSANNGAFDYLTKASAVFSSNIEGNTVDLNSFMNYELSKSKFKPGKEIQEIEELIQAYQFAQNNPLTESNFLATHKLLSKSILIKSKRGKYRQESVGVFSSQGLSYLAIEAEFVEREMKIFFKEIQSILDQKSSISEAFYFASFIHLRFAHIHPFMDGNGRAARLLEKWFLAQSLGKEYWKIRSEECYKNKQAAYYQNINLGVNFYELNYQKAIPFLLMLPECMKQD